ncbi:MAG: hypothetical protein ACE5ES_03875 [Candidatus Nanoarchaeia archaeon]
MVKKISFMVVMLVLLVSVLGIASAYSTEIKIKTIPYHEVQLATYDPDSSAFSLFERFKGDSDQYGDVNFTFDSEESSFNIIVYIKKNGKKVYYETFADNFKAGEPVYLEVAPSGFKLFETPKLEINNSGIISQENESVENTEEANSTSGAEDEGEKGAGVTGAIIGMEFINSTTLYYAGIVVAVLILSFIVFMVLKKRKMGEKSIKVRKLSEIKDEKKEMIENSRKIIEDAERKIKEAQEEIRKLKNEDKIREVKKRIEEDEKELIRLREGKE